MPTPDSGVSHDVTITITPKRMSGGEQPPAHNVPVPTPPFPMTASTTADPTADVFGPRISPSIVRSRSARKGTAANPHDETYTEGGVNDGAVGGLEPRWYIVIRGREVGKLYRSWHDVLPLIQAEPGSEGRFLKNAKWFRPLTKEQADIAFLDAKEKREFRVIG